MSWISAGLSTDRDGELRWDAEAATFLTQNSVTTLTMTQLSESLS